jgi:hypothetical protein
VGEHFVAAGCYVRRIAGSGGCPAIAAGRHSALAALHRDLVEQHAAGLRDGRRRRLGNEIYLAIRNVGGSGLVNHHDRLYLQFRNGRLAGWKGDWGHNWMWQ